MIPTTLGLVRIVIAGPTHAAVLVMACAVLAACSAPTVVLDTPTGVTPLYSPAPVMPGGLVGPPPGLDNQVLSPGGRVNPGPTDRSGTYAGTAVPLVTGGGRCLQDQPVSGFQVRGNSVQFDGYRGTIAPDGGLQMVNGSTWIVGQFEGTVFRGQIDVNQGFGNPLCTFMLTLQRMGP